MSMKYPLTEAEKNLPAGGITQKIHIHDSVLRLDDDVRLKDGGSILPRLNWSFSFLEETEGQCDEKR